MNAYLRYMDNNRQMLKSRYKSFDYFVRRYKVPNNLMDEIVNEAKRQKIEPKDEEELKNSIIYMELQLKALVARDLWDMNEYFRVWNEQNDIVKKALEVMGGVATR